VLTLGIALAADIGSAVADYTVSSSMVAVSSRDHWSFHLRNFYGMLGCDFVVRLFVAMAIAIAAAVKFVDYISAMVAPDF
jgi:hypothetical protein